MKKPILVLGIPRSGSTWLSNILSINKNIKYIYEPDNEKNNVMAYYYKKNLHRFPYLKIYDNQEDYYKLWKNAFLGIDFNSEIFKMKNHMIEKEIQEKTNSYHNKSLNNKSKKRFIKKILTLNPFVFKIISKSSYLTLPYTNFKKNRIIVKSVHGLLTLEWLLNNFDINIVTSIA